MIYSKNKPPIKCIMKNSTCYKNTGKATPVGVLWHSTGADNPDLKRYVQPFETDSNYDEMIALLGKNRYGNDWNHVYRKAGVHAFIGKLADGTVTTVQTLEWNQKAWGCASGKNGSCNRIDGKSWIQFEIAEDSLTDKTYFEKVYKEACEFTAYICNMFNLDPHGYVTVKGMKVPVILCHYDSYELGLGNNHHDIYHWFKKHGKDMDDVRSDVAALMGKRNNTNTSPSPSTSASAPTVSALKFKVGDIVNFVGDTHYSSANATIGKVVKASEAKVVSVYKTGKHPYRLRAINNKGEFISGVYGWVDTSAVSEIKTETTTNTTTINKINTIKEVQNWANTNYQAGLVVDGKYGSKTKKALIKILQIELNQTYNTNLAVDGSFGSKTKAACPNLKKGIKNNVVGALQALLICNGYTTAYLDKSYGGATMSAVKSYQSKNGLTVDGVAGKNTFAKLCN